MVSNSVSVKYCELEVMLYTLTEEEEGGCVDGEILQITVFHESSIL